MKKSFITAGPGSCAKNKFSNKRRIDLKKVKEYLNISLVLHTFLAKVRKLPNYF